MASEVFISYSSKDQSIAHDLCDSLESEGIDCWIAPRDIVPGSCYSASIIDAITESLVVVFVFSAQSNESQHVVRELDCAAKRHKIIIPFRIEAIEPSKTVEYFVSTAHWFDAFPEPSREDFGRLAQKLKEVLNKADSGEGTSRVRFRGAPAEEVEKRLAAIGSERPQNRYERRLKAAHDLLTREELGECIQECGDIFETAMKELLGDLLEWLRDQNARRRIQRARDNIHPDASSIDDFNLEELVRLYRRAEVLDLLRVQLTSNLAKSRQIDWDQILDWRGAVDAETPGRQPDREAAMQTLYWTKLFLHDAELAGAAPSVSVEENGAAAPTICPCCEFPVEGDWSYCPECGAALRVVCDACERVLAPDFRICPYCETPVPQRGRAQVEAAQRAKEEYRVLCLGAYLDGVVNMRERALLNNKRLELGVSAEDAEAIERQCAPENVVEFTRLVEGVLVDEQIDEVEQEFLDAKARQLGVDPWVAEQIQKVTFAMRTRDTEAAASA